jgi:7-cyano-7-deazaguanine synthase
MYRLGKGLMTTDDSRAVVLASGGIDSTLCMHLLREDGISFRALHIDFGQPASALEWAAVQRVMKRLDAASSQVQVRSATQFEPGEVRGRNAAFVFLALMHLRPTERLVCLGIHAGTPFFDCSRAFFDATAKLVAEHTDSKVALIAPLRDHTKPEIVAFARSLDIPLEETYSCQRGIPSGCGECHSCKDREALGC